MLITERREDEKKAEERDFFLFYSIWMDEMDLNGAVLKTSGNYTSDSYLCELWNI